MMLRHPALAAVLLVASAGSATNAEEAPGILAGPVTYEVKSWGRTIDRWQVLPDGTGELWRAPQPVGGDQRIAKFHIRLSGTALVEFARAVDAASRAARKKVKCKKDIYDAPYGTIVWDYPGAPQTFKFDSGCRSKSVEAIMFKIGDANEIIHKQGLIDSEPFEVDSGN